MGTEIERKFKVLRKPWTNKDIPSEIIQGYLNLDSERTVRIRAERHPNEFRFTKATITIKGEPIDISRTEFEYIIPYGDAQQMLDNGMCVAKLRKRRYRIRYKTHYWEVDEFLDNNKGLILAEIELSSTSDKWEKPDWVGEEVTHDPNYYNSRLVIKSQTE